MIKDVIRLNSLYDYYGELLTENQQKSFYYYYRLDFSLSEISEEIGISKQGVSENLKRATKELENFEDKLKLLEKTTNITGYLADLKNEIAELNNDVSEKLSNLVDKIAEEL